MKTDRQTKIDTQKCFISVLADAVKAISSSVTGLMNDFNCTQIIFVWFHWPWINFIFIFLSSLSFTQHNNYGRPDEVIAAETLANHIRCNNSFVQAVFQAQFRSSLACPRCHRQSNTFDPFHCVSVQLPQLAQHPVYVTVLYATQHPRQVKLGLSVPAGSPVIALREQLHADTGIAIDRMVLVEITSTGFVRVICDSHPIASLTTDDKIFCIEIPASSEANKQPVTLKNSKETSKDATNRDASNELTLIAMNAKRISAKDNDVERFSTPFCIHVNRDISFTELQKRLLKEMQTILRSEVFTFSTPINDMFRIRLQDPSADPDTYIESNVSFVLLISVCFSDCE